MSNIFIADNCISVEFIEKYYKQNIIFIPDIVYYDIAGLKPPYDYQKELSQIVMSNTKIIHTQKANDFCELVRLQEKTKEDLLHYDLVTESTLQALDSVLDILKGRNIAIMGSNITTFNALDVDEYLNQKNYQDMNETFTDKDNEYLIKNYTKR